MDIAVIHQMSLRCSRPKARSAAGALALLAILLGCGGQPTTANQPPKTPPTKPGYFGTEPAHSTFVPRSDAYCASAVTPNSYEPRPDNDQANHTVLSPPYNWSVENYWTKWRDKRAQVTGNFTGTTTEIIQWAACKWGWSDNVVRAQAIQESGWHQDTLGDSEGPGSPHCTYDNPGGDCPTSFSIIQIRWYYHPAGTRSGTPQSSYPNARRSTAYALDQELAEMRGRYDGMSTYLGRTRGDLGAASNRGTTARGPPAAVPTHARSIRSSPPSPGCTGTADRRERASHARASRHRRPVSSAPVPRTSAGCSRSRSRWRARSHCRRARASPRPRPAAR